ncbi:MAG: Fe-S cluster assembly ATPase SufC [Ruminococcaceae bacterium]|jgi:FeS assembly ATPase SufC|nr:Fe-S cluster assembly ATPase SufC [Oscillospiraceae bacterium]
MSATLTVKGLKAGVGEKEILHGIDLVINPGETHVFMGPNGAGKSTLGNAIMGHPAYEVTEGSIQYGDLDLLEETADKRAKAGLFMTFQNPIEVPGITVANFMRNAIEMRTGERVKLWNFRKKVKEIANILTIPEDYADRDLNVGFSGGEKKKAEILQLLILDPDLAILDETDSGLDVDAVRVVSKGIQEFQKKEGKSLFIITHNAAILEALDVTHTHILVDGKIVKSGGKELIDEIFTEGFEKYIEAEKAE